MPLPNSNGTLLILTNMGIPFYSARGLTQTLTPIKQSEVQEYTINGTLLDLSYAQFRKYSSVISCTDMNTMAPDGIWPGQQVIVSCVKELFYPVGGTPQRTVVAGSSRTDNGFVFYRPVLTMMLGSWQDQIAEYSADCQWQIPFVEV